MTMPFQCFPPEKFNKLNLTKKEKQCLTFEKKQESEGNKTKGPELEQGQRHGRLDMEETVLALSCCCMDKSPRIPGLQGTCVSCANLFDNTILPISLITK